MAVSETVTARSKFPSKIESTEFKSLIVFFRACRPGLDMSSQMFVHPNHQTLCLSAYLSVSVFLVAAEQATTLFNRTRTHIMETDTGLWLSPVIQKQLALTHRQYPTRGLSLPPAPSQAPAPDTVPIPGPGRSPHISAAALR